MALRITDDRNRVLIIGAPPKRVISLVPSDTYSLFALGLGDRVVGRTDYCVEPVGEIERVPTCGGTKNIDVEKVASLEPDLIFCNQEENSKKPLEELAQRGFKVFCSFQRRVSESVNHVARMAKIFSVQGSPQVRTSSNEAMKICVRWRAAVQGKSSCQSLFPFGWIRL